MNWQVYTQTHPAELQNWMEY